MMPAPAAGSTGPGGPSPTGVLLIRVWTEGPADQPQLRARLVSRLSVEDDDTTSTFASSLDEIVAATRDWLERFRDRP